MVTQARLERVGRLISDWSVPVICVAIATIVWADFVESTRREWLVNELSAMVLEESPETLDELLGVIHGRLDTYEVYSARPEDGSSPYAVIQLKPRVWVHVVAQLDAKESALECVYFIYAASEEIPIDEPERLPLGTPPWYVWVLPGLLAAVPSAHWLYTRAEKPQPFVVAFLLVVLDGVFIVLLTAMALLAWMRITM